MTAAKRAFSTKLSGELVLLPPRTPASACGHGREAQATRPATQGNVVIQGNLIVSGIKNAAVPRAGGKHQLLYCLESPESWLEDFGEARLVNGRVRIRIDPGFRNTIDTRSYHVFVSAYGPDPVFVSNRSRNGFEKKRTTSASGLRVSRTLPSYPCRIAVRAFPKTN